MHGRAFGVSCNPKLKTISENSNMFQKEIKDAAISLDWQRLRKRSDSILRFYSVLPFTILSNATALTHSHPTSMG